MRALIAPFGRIFLLAAMVFAYYAGASLGFVEPQSWGPALCANFGVPLLIVWWIELDAARTRYWPAYHYALFLLMLSPVAVPHYVLHTRGWRGVGLAALFFSALCAPILGWGFGRLLWPLVGEAPTG